MILVSDYSNDTYMLHTSSHFAQHLHNIGNLMVVFGSGVSVGCLSFTQVYVAKHDQTLCGTPAFEPRQPDETPWPNCVSTEVRSLATRISAPHLFEQSNENGCDDCSALTSGSTAASLASLLSESS